jgi:Na+-driven multidrug efflux pump
MPTLAFEAWLVARSAFNAGFGVFGIAWGTAIGIMVGGIILIMRWRFKLKQL